MEKSLFPLVSIGVASFNNAKYIVETLDSVKNSDYPNIEIIVVDDKSTDNSVEVIQNWFNYNLGTNGRLIQHNVNKGLCHACNTIITNAKGEFVSVLGSDDLYVADKISKQVLLFQKSKNNLGVIFGEVDHINGLGQLIDAPVVWPPGQSGDVFLPLLKVNFIPAMSALVRRSCYDKVGLYDEELAFEDWDMWLRIAREYQFIYMPQVIARYRIHDNSFTFRRRQQMLESSLRLLQKHRGHSPDADRLIAGHTRQFAESLYQIGSTQAHYWLRRAVSQSPDILGISLLAMATLGIPPGKLGQIKKRIQVIISNKS